MLKRNDTAPFDLLSWLEGRTLAEGVFEDRGGRVRRRFTVELNGRPDQPAEAPNSLYELSGASAIWPTVPPGVIALNGLSQRSEAALVL